tara:strand:- start:6 stop:173 length:168 start_codon:yes stop_codon:yes gene_type:complete
MPFNVKEAIMCCRIYNGKLRLSTIALGYIEKNKGEWKNWRLVFMERFGTFAEMFF